MRNATRGRLRWAVLGGGLVSQSHVRSLHASPHAEVVAVVDRHPERVGPLAEIAGADPVASLDELLERDDIDAATVALPTAQHVEVAARLAERGIHVLCEKPLAPTAEDARRMVDACAAAGVQLGTIFNTRGLPAARWVREQVRSGVLDVRAVHISCRMGGAGRAPMDTTQLVGAIGVHYIDLLDWWFGAPIRLSMVDAPGAVAAVFGFDGVAADLHLSIGGPTHHGVSVEVVTAGGRITLDPRGGVSAEGDVPELPPVRPPLEGHPFGPGHLVVLDEAAAAVAAGEPFPVTGADGMRASALCDALLATASADLVPTIELLAKEH